MSEDGRKAEPGRAWLRVPGHVNPMYYAVQAARCYQRAMA